MKTCNPLCLSVHGTNLGFIFGLMLLALALLALSSGSLHAAVPEAKALESLDDMRAGSGALGDRSAMPGAPLFAQHCAGCHEGQVYKAPHTSWLEMMSVHTLYRSLTEGVMQTQASALSDDNKRDIAEYIAQARLDSAPDEPAVVWCAETVVEKAFNASELTGWGRDTNRFVPHDVAGLSNADLTNLELKWSFGFPGATRARSQPIIAMDTVYVGSQDGTVYAFDLETGCARWTYEARAEVRTGVVLGESQDGSGTLAFFGDIIGTVYAVNARTGEEMWQRSADDHHSATLTGTPAFLDGRLYVPVSSLEVIPAANPEYVCCSFRGHVLALEADSGQTVWDSYSIPAPAVSVGKTSAGVDVLAPSGAPVWTSPTIDKEKNLLLFGTGENYSSPADNNSDSIIAVDLDTGARRWARQTFEGDAWNVACMMANNPNCPEEDGPDYDQASSPLLITTKEGKTFVVAGQKDGRVFALDWQTGQDKYWEVDLGRGSIQGGVHFGMAAAEQTVYVPINDMNDTRNGEWLDPALVKPGLSALNVETGEVLWQHVQENLCPEDRPLCDPGISAPVTALENAVIAGHLDGYVRIYDAKNGEVLWSFNTVRPFDTVNGIAATGGGMSGSGPAVGAGHVVLNSGYGLYFHEPGNALLVFAPAGD